MTYNPEITLFDPSLNLSSRKSGTGSWRGETLERGMMKSIFA
jgi:hypothetical protein